MSLRFTAQPLKSGRHPKYRHLVMAEIDAHHGMYLFRIIGHPGTALLSEDDARHILGDCFDREWGYVTDEYLSILELPDAEKENA